MKVMECFSMVHNRSNAFELKGRVDVVKKKENETAYIFHHLNFGLCSRAFIYFVSIGDHCSEWVKHVLIVLWVFNIESSNRCWQF